MAGKLDHADLQSEDMRRFLPGVCGVDKEEDGLETSDVDELTESKPIAGSRLCSCWTKPVLISLPRDRNTGWASFTVFVIGHGSNCAVTVAEQSAYSAVGLLLNVK